MTNLHCPCCGTELIECPICHENGEHKRTGGKFQDIAGITCDDWKRVYELVQQQQQERLALVHQIEMEIQQRSTPNV